MKKRNRLFVVWILSLAFWSAVFVVLEICFHLSGFWLRTLVSILCSATVFIYAWRTGEFNRE